MSFGIALALAGALSIIVMGMSLLIAIGDMKVKDRWDGLAVATQWGIGILALALGLWWLGHILPVAIAAACRSV